MVTKYVNTQEKSTQQSQYYNEVKKFIKNSPSNNTSDVKILTSSETSDEILSQCKLFLNKIIINQKKILAKSLSLNQIENSNIQADYCHQQSLKPFQTENQEYISCKLNENFSQQDQLHTENNDQSSKSQQKNHLHFNLQKTIENQNNLQTFSHLNQQTQFIKNHQQLKLENCSLIQAQSQNPKILISDQKKLNYLDQSHLNKHDSYSNEIDDTSQPKLKQQLILNTSEVLQKHVLLLPQQINVIDNSTKINFKNYQNANINSSINIKSQENNLLSTPKFNILNQDNRQTFNKEFDEQNQQKQHDKNKIQYSNQNLNFQNDYKEPQQQFGLQQKANQQSFKYQQILNQTQVKVLHQNNFNDEFAKTPASDFLKNSNLTTASQLTQFLQNPNLLQNLSQEQISALLSGSNTGNINSHNLVEVLGTNSGNKFEHQTNIQHSKNQHFQQQLSRPQSVLPNSFHLEQSTQQSTVQLQRPLSNLAVAAATVNSNILVPSVSTNSNFNNDSSVNAQLLALYNRFNLINSPLLHQNAAAIYARTFNPNINSLQKSCMFVAYY